MTHKEFVSLSPAQQEQVIETYKDFFRSLNEELSAQNSGYEKTWSLIAQAFADEAFDCVYSGWPSKRVNGRCSNPVRHNPVYVIQAGSCSGNKLLCQPLLFGPNLCASTSTQAQRNTAFAQCESLAKADGRTTRSIAEALSRPPQSTEADALFSTVDRICTSGFQARTGMCRNLQTRVAAIREARPATDTPQVAAVAKVEPKPALATPTVTTAVPETPTPQPTPAETTEVIRSSLNILETLPADITGAIDIRPDCIPPLLPGVVAARVDPARSPAEAIAPLNRKVLTPDPAVPVIMCPQAPADYDPGDTATLIRELNITFYPNQESVVPTPEFRAFVFELRKFPRQLLLEMARRKGGIRVIASGKGIASDPLRAVERDRNIEMIQTALDWNAAHPDRTIEIKTTIEEVERRYNYTFDNRPWTETSGSGGVFGDPNFSIPTRVNIKELYYRSEVDSRGKVLKSRQGTVNLLLHEHGHALDNAYRFRGISKSDTWESILSDPLTKAYLPKILTSYEDDSEQEAFAELFAYYHSCDEARTQMEAQSPRLYNFFRNLRKALPYR